MDTSALYEGDYVSSNYSDDDGIRRNFERIIALDPSRSDNTGRVRRVLEFAAARSGEDGTATPSILDVGSGLCVFLHRMKEAGWDCTALDPDARSARHARETVGVKAVCGDFMSEDDLGRFDFITFNKVLEHVKDPVAMLAKSAAHLGPRGFVYIELPDGEAAVVDGSGREEFFIDHWHVFSAASIALLASRAGFTLCAMERLREPSSKYTIYAFLKPRG
jgi:SAM-dependent methyltransferase